MGFVKWAAIIIGVALAIAALVTAINYLIGRGKEMNEFSKNMSQSISGVGSVMSGASVRGSNVSSRYVDGSHRNGLDYVPFDGYVAELHKGEKVVTAEENNKSSGGDTYYITIDAKNVDDFTKVVKLAKEQKSARIRGEVPI